MADNTTPSKESRDQLKCKIYLNRLLLLICNMESFEIDPSTEQQTVENFYMDYDDEVEDIPLLN